MPLRIIPKTESENKDNRLKSKRRLSRENAIAQDQEMLAGKDFAKQIELDGYPLIMNVSEVSRVLRISRHMVYRLVESGMLAHIKIGPRCNRIYRESVRRLLDERSSD